MARADTRTLLSLDEFARVLGLNPLHFNGGRLPDVTDGEPYTYTMPFQSQNELHDGLGNRPIMHQFEWQDSTGISRETIAREIALAERDVADFLGYWPAPTWIAQEVHKYPRPYRAELFGAGYDVRSQFKGINTRYKKVIQVGRRATTLIGTATVVGATLVYSDPQSLGWDSLATITLPTELTNECEIKVYFVDKNGDPAWEVRPLKSVSIAGGFVTITLDSWLLFDPDIVNAVPIGEITAINASTGSNYVTSIEVRREYTDFTQASATLLWEREPYVCTSCGGVGCEVCSLISQDACASIKDAENGILAPIVAASYDESDARWEFITPTACREPDQVKVWYYSGDYSQAWLNGYTCTPMDQTMARTITFLALSRLEGQFRAQSPLAEIIEYWRRDQAETIENSTVFTPPDVLANPFGTRRGEVQAYKTLMKLRERKIGVSAVAA